jgi:hypothetical protein
MALPSEGSEIHDFNSLPGVLGKSSSIDIQSVSGAEPKQSTSDLQARRLVAQFGFGYELALAVSALAYAVPR